MQRLLFLSGFILFLLSLVLAFYFRYNHFYEVTLVGLFLILFSQMKTKLFGPREFVFTYILYFFFGLLLDLFSQFFGFWKYSYISLLEYLSLFLIIYPLGGVVMLQSFFFVKEKTNFKFKNRNLSRKKIFLLPFIIYLVVLFIILLTSAEPFLKLGLFIMASLIIIPLIICDIASDRFYKKSFFRDLMENLVPIAIIVFLATYINAFIHEVPNTFATQWIYTIETNSILDLPILGIPLIVWLGWLVLTIGPVIMYYFIHYFFSEKH